MAAKKGPRRWTSCNLLNTWSKVRNLVSLTRLSGQKISNETIFKNDGWFITLWWSQCSYTVVMAIPQVNGEWRFSTIWDSETLEPIELKLIDQVQQVFKSSSPARDPACKNWWPSDKGGKVGVWVKLSPRVLFLVSRIRPQLTPRMSAWRSMHQKTWFRVS